MSGHLSFAGWFQWGYIGTTLAWTLLSAWWLFDVARRPRDRFPAGWPYAKVRWGLVPASWLVAVLLQTVLFGLQFAKVRIDLGWIGMVTFILYFAFIVVGIAYLLRVVFPREPHDGESAGDDIGEPTDGSQDEPHLTAAPIEHPEDEPVDLL